jgi:hypothetical protein
MATIGAAVNQSARDGRLQRRQTLLPRRFPRPTSLISLSSLSGAEVLGLALARQPQCRLLVGR